MWCLIPMIAFLFFGALFFIRQDRAAQRSPRALTLKAQELLDEGRTEDAIAHVLLAIEKNPMAWGSWLLVADIYERLDGEKEAIDALESALACCPSEEKPAIEERLARLQGL